MHGPMRCAGASARVWRGAALLTWWSMHFQYSLYQPEQFFPLSGPSFSTRFPHSSYSFLCLAHAGSYFLLSSIFTSTGSSSDMMRAAAEGEGRDRVRTTMRTEERQRSGKRRTPMMTTAHAGSSHSTVEREVCAAMR